jgi:hypothetical protein
MAWNLSGFVFTWFEQNQYTNVHVLDCIIICILIQGIVRYEIKYIVYKNMGANVEPWYTALYIYLYNYVMLFLIKNIVK